MPLTLVTGPANAGKARLVLDGVRARARQDPLLVVPTVRDASVYRRELAESGTVFGAAVITFDDLAGMMARRAGTPLDKLGPAQRDRLLARAVHEARLEVLAESSRSPGFVRAVGDLVAELQRELVTPQRFAQAMRAYGEANGREGYAREVAALYSGYRGLLERLDRADAELRAWKALDALRLDPVRWGTTPVFLYGFDDLTALQRDAVETLSRAEGVDVTVALTYEPRHALAGRASTFQELLPLAARHEELQARAEYYETPALHHLERGLFEEQVERVDPGDAVRLLEAGGHRAEVELVAAEVRALLDDGMAPEEIAVVYRSADQPAALVRSVFEEFGIPVAVSAPLPLRTVPLGRGLLGLLRCALTDSARAEDLLAWLRTPGLLDRPVLADALEADVRRDGTTSAVRARALWESKRWPLETIDRLAGAQGRDLLEAVAVAAESLLAAPRRRAAAVLNPAERLDAAALREVLTVLGGLGSLARQDRALAPSPPELLEALERVEVREPPAPGCVQVLDPLSIRARRVRALFVCGLQEGEFPRPARPEPFLPDEVRRRVAEASGLALRARDDVLDDERALFYAVASRPEALLGLAYRSSDEEGRPAVRSFFVDDVRDLFTERLDERRRVRSLASVAWPDGLAPTRRERARQETAAAPPVAAPPIAPLRAPEVLEDLASREAWSAAHLEAFAGCPVQWLVDRYLRPQSFEPESEPLARGLAAHDLLERTLSRLREERGSARLDDASLPRAREILDSELEAAAAEGRLRMSVDPARSRSVKRRLQADLLRYLRRCAERPSPFAPEHFELDFGGSGDELAALKLDGLNVRGRIDRVDLDGAGHAAVVDYKGSQAYPVARWEPDGRLQVALYMLAVRELLGVDPVAGFYQATSGADQDMRGVVRDDSALAVQAKKTDRVPPEELDAILADAAARAEDVARRLIGGELEGRPDSCGWESKCQYPEVCRCERR